MAHSILVYRDAGKEVWKKRELLKQEGLPDHVASEQVMDWLLNQYDDLGEPLTPTQRKMVRKKVHYCYQVFKTVSTEAILRLQHVSPNILRRLTKEEIQWVAETVLLSL